MSTVREYLIVDLMYLIMIDIMTLFIILEYRGMQVLKVELTSGLVHGLQICRTRVQFPMSSLYFNVTTHTRGVV